MICADLDLGVELRADHARHILSWFKVLTDDPRAIFTAAS
ncbi:zincin-like metallopeptidase domain-containing protein [Rhizobium sullae]